MNKWTLVASLGGAVGLWAATNALNFFLGKSWERAKAKGREHLLKAPRVDHWVEQLNEAMAGKVVFHSEIRMEPEIVLLGDYKLTEAQEALRKDHLARIQEREIPNDAHAILVKAPDWRLDPVRLEVRHLDYAGVCALRDTGERPAILSSNAVIVCEEAGELVIQRRGHDVATFPEHLHTFGGAFIPQTHAKGIGDRDLRTTFEREMLEESTLALTEDSELPMVLAEEVPTGFIQLIRIGYNIDLKRKGRCMHTWEGRVQFIKFDNLLEEIEQDRWVPTGLGHVLAWLALGTPGLKIRPKFKGLRSDKLFKTILRSPWFPGKLNGLVANPDKITVA
ncbi:MAG: hypothetical protein P4L36_14460 [Holophaga sp.]|nr:hypothetical protein [Holophaga sp.]